MRRMNHGQGGQSQWDPWKPHSQQPWNGGGDEQTPDWAALAEASEARKKRRRLLFTGGGVLATAAVGAAVAVAVVSADGGGGTAGAGASQPAGGTRPSGSAAPSFAPTSAPPPLDPKDFISSARKDTAPLGPATLFADPRLTVNGAAYQKGATADTRSCAAAAQGTLGKVLTGNGCTRLIRATYTADGVAVTVGVAVFDSEAQATRAKGQADQKSIVEPLAGKGVKTFCDGAVCRSTTNSYGRYAYFTLAGFPSGKDVTKKDTKVFRAGDDLAAYAFRQIRGRGEAQASAAANR
jgi:hypothetical protein